MTAIRDTAGFGTSRTARDPPQNSSGKPVSVLPDPAVGEADRAL